eukprot:3096856-Rhodomonas_salina.1
MARTIRATSSFRSSTSSTSTSSILRRELDSECSQFRVVNLFSHGFTPIKSRLTRTRTNSIAEK